MPGPVVVNIANGSPRARRSVTWRANSALAIPRRRYIGSTAVRVMRAAGTVTGPGTVSSSRSEALPPTICPPSNAASVRSSSYISAASATTSSVR
jgi:hypothetical protein